MLRKIIVAALAAAIPVGVLAQAQSPVAIKFSHVVTADTPKGKGADFFRKCGEERAKGRVSIEVYPSSTLYKDGEELNALQLGAVQMLAPSLAKFGPLGVREFEVFDLPYIFDSYEDLHKVTDGSIGQSMLKKLESKGVVGLAYWDNGFREMTANKALRTPDDFKGLKMRIQSSKVLDLQMRALGAVPQIMAFSEVYQAMQTGVVDGSENTPSNIYTQKDLRTTLEGCMKDATKHANDSARKDNEDALEAIRRSGRTQVIQLTPAEKAAWRKALVKVHQQSEDRIPRELMQAIYKETGFKPE